MKRRRSEPNGFDDIQSHTSGKWVLPCTTPHGETARQHHTTVPKYLLSRWPNINDSGSLRGALRRTNNATTTCDTEPVPYHYCSTAKICGSQERRNKELTFIRLQQPGPTLYTLMDRSGQTANTCTQDTRVLTYMGRCSVKGNRAERCYSCNTDLIIFC